MSGNKHRTSESIESLLLDLSDADRAGVFRRTEVTSSSRATVGSSPRMLVFRLSVAGLAAAACLGLFALLLNAPGVGLMGPGTTGAVATRPFVTVTEFTGCVAGPMTDPARGDCSPADQDADGDVDLADYRVMQLAGTRSM